MNNPPFDNHYMENEMDENQPDIPPTRNSHQPPNLNMTVPGHGRGYEGGQNIGEGDNGNSESDGEASTAIGLDGGIDEYENADDVSIGDGSVNGDEGPEDHLIDVADLGVVPSRTVERTLARYRPCICGRPCICREGITPPPWDPFSLLASPADSCMGTPHGSMVVEVGSMSSSYSFGNYNGSSPYLSDLIDFMDGGYEGELAFHGLPPLFSR